MPCIKQRQRKRKHFWRGNGILVNSVNFRFLRALHFAISGPTNFFFLFWQNDSPIMQIDRVSLFFGKMTAKRKRF